MKVWSKYQQGVFNFVQNEQGNAIVEAVAGSGKSTTIVEAVKRIGNKAEQGIDQNLDVIFLAFNKDIAEELKAKGVNARTFHSLTYSPTLKHKGARTANTNKMQELVKSFLSYDDMKMYGTFCSKLVAQAKGVGIGCLIPDTLEAWYDIINHHDMDLDHEDALMSKAVEIARQLLQLSQKSKEVDFDDMLYVPVMDGLLLQQYDWVFVDEAQDLNPIQRAIVKKIMKPTSRLVAVGDPAQAIYGFRGADNDSLEIIAKEFNCKRLPLTVTYRCASKIVDFSKQWVSHIEAREGAPEGEVLNLDIDWKVEQFQSTDMVVCRNNKPLVELAYTLIKNRIPARILGREIGQGLTSLIKKLNAKGIDALEVKLQEYAQREIQKALVQDKEHKIQTIEDKVESIMVLIENLPETQRTIPALIEVIESLFSNKSDAVTLCSIHKSKGLEADRVYWLCPSLCPNKYAKKAWQKQQEKHLMYVAATRAKTSLVLIEMP